MGLSNGFDTKDGYVKMLKSFKNLMQLTTNQKDDQEMKVQAEALDKTIKYL